MKSFYKGFLSSLLGFSVLVGSIIVIEGTNPKTNWLALIVVILIGSLLIGYVFHYYIKYYQPKRKVKVTKKILNIFNPNELGNDTYKIKIHKFDIVIELFMVEVSLNMHSSEMIRFYIPCEQIDSLITKPKFRFKKAKVLGMSLYHIYETNAMGLKLAKKKLNSRLKGF